MPDAKDFFTDSAAYDRAMGRCSRVAGEIFLDWLSLPSGLQWLDVGCGTGSFTELVIDRKAPGAISAIDPSEGQIAFAKGKPWAGNVEFRVADAMSLPYGNDEYDVAVMALVMQYVPDPSKAMSELVRVVRPGGTIATYTWPGSLEEHPMQPMTEAINTIGISRTRRPGTNIRTLDALTALFDASGLVDIDKRSIEIQLVYEDFDDYWSSQTAENIGDMTEAEVQRLKTLLRERLPADPNGQISYRARANAVRGLVPA